MPKKKLPHDLGEQLIEHMSKGYSFGSFPSVCKIPEEELLEYAKRNKDFDLSMRIAKATAKMFFDKLYIAATTGQLKSVMKETVKKSWELDKNGKPVKDKEGNPVIHEEVLERTYSKTNPFKEVSWIFVMKCRFGYNDGSKESEGLIKGARTRDFKLKYNPSDPPHKITGRPDFEAQALELMSETKKNEEEPHGNPLG